MLAPIRRISVALIAVALAAAGAPAASASQGSVPAEVAAYAADDDGLLARLDDLAGISASGKGIDFGETTEVGQLNRVYVFTADWLAGAETETPVELANEWTTPILISGKPVGLAVIWINPDTESPELAEFFQEVDLATLLSDVPSDAYLVRDLQHNAWFSLVPPALAPLEPGTSGLSGPTTLTVYQRLIGHRAATEPAPVEPINLGSVLSVAAIAATATVILVVLALPLVRRRRAEPGEPGQWQ